MSFRDIGIILNKADEGRVKNNNNNNDIENKKPQTRTRTTGVISYLYLHKLRLFSERKKFNTSSSCIKRKRVRDNQILQRVLQAIKPNARPQYCL